MVLLAYNNFINCSIVIKIMKKRLSGCSECGDDTAILTQVSSGPEVILLCTDCYNLKHSNETQNHISYEEEKS
jgi:hypothetical protein